MKHLLKFTMIALGMCAVVGCSDIPDVESIDPNPEVDQAARDKGIEEMKDRLKESQKGSGRK